MLDLISQLFIPTAHAATAAAETPQAGGSSFMIMTAALIFMMYFMVWRPQSRRAREARDLVNAIAKGDEVVTTGGLLGTITKVTDSHVRLMLADGVEVALQKSSVTSLLPKGTLKTL